MTPQATPQMILLQLKAEAESLQRKLDNSTRIIEQYTMAQLEFQAFVKDPGLTNVTKLASGLAAFLQGQLIGMRADRDQGHVILTKIQEKIREIESPIQIPTLQRPR